MTASKITIFQNIKETSQTRHKLDTIKLNQA